MSTHNIQDTRAPFMLLQGCDSVQPWHEGALLSYRLGTNAMQVSTNALQLYASDNLHFGPEWRVFNCTATSAALCKSIDTGVALLGSAAVTTPRDVLQLLPRSALLREFDGVVCRSDATGRSVGESDLYTVSMCDLVEGGLRFVVQNTAHGDVAFWIRDTTGIAETVVLCVVALYAATNLAQNIASMISTNVATVVAWSEAVNVLACFVCVAVLIVLCETHRAWYVSLHDIALYYVLLGFLCADVLLLCFKALGNRNNNNNFGHQIGISTVVLLLVTLRLHNTFATPFFLVLFGIFGARTACKLLQHMHSCFVSCGSDINLLSVLLDLLVWCALLAYSLVEAFSLEQQLVVAVNVTVALLLGLAMSVFIAERAPDDKS